MLTLGLLQFLFQILLFGLQLWLGFEHVRLS